MSQLNLTCKGVKCFEKNYELEAEITDPDEEALIEFVMANCTNEDIARAWVYVSGFDDVIKAVESEIGREELIGRLSLTRSDTE